MKLLIEVEIKADPGEYASIKSVKCNGEEIKQVTEFGMDAVIFPIPTGEELICGKLDLVQWYG